MPASSSLIQPWKTADLSAAKQIDTSNDTWLYGEVTGKSLPGESPSCLWANIKMNKVMSVSDDRKLTF